MIAFDKNLLAKNLMKANFSIMIFFITYFIFGLVIVGDYGISTDEPTERETSWRQYKFAISKIYFVMTKKELPSLVESHVWHQNYLQGSRDKYYGTFLQWPILALEHFTNFEMPLSQVYLWRHRLNFFYFFSALICFYLLLKQRFKHSLLALIGVLMVALHPRFFAEAFYNNKDVLFAATYIIAIYFGDQWLRKKSWLSLWPWIIASALAMNTRVLALIIPLIYCSADIFQLAQSYIGQKIKLKNIIVRLSQILVALILIFVIYILTHPTAWGNELNFIFEVFKSFSHYDLWQGATLYFGKLILWNEVPWHFIAGYLWVTTPIIFSTLIIIGSLLYVYNLIRLIKKDFSVIKLNKIKLYFCQKNNFLHQMFSSDNLVFITFLAPMLAVIIFQSVLYNSWRHLYFSYFSLVYFAIYGLQWLLNHQKIKLIVIVVVSLSLINTLNWIFVHHPYQYAYYNYVVRSNVANSFERDYWHVSLEELLNHIWKLELNSNQNIPIWKNDPLHKYINWTMNNDKREKFIYVENQNEAKYATIYFYNFQGNQLKDNLYEDNLLKTTRDFSQFKVIKTIEVDNYLLSILFQNLESTNDAKLSF